MKRMIKLFVFAAIVAAFAVPALAQSKDCTDENKSAWYDTFLKNYKGESAQQKVAYDAAKQYLSCTSDPSDQYAAYLKKFVDLIDTFNKAQDLNKQFDAAYKNKNYADQMRLGKQILTGDPDNATVNIIMGVAGLGDANVLNESSQYARKAIALIESGKPATPYQKDQALAYLNWNIGKASLSSAPADSIPYLLKAAKLESEVKKNPQLYLELAAAYENGPRAKFTDEYKSKQGPNGTETPESKLVLENLNQVIDRQIDALARAAALTTNANDKKTVMDDILSKPLPEMPAPLTSLPTTSTPTGSPTNVGSPGTNGGAGNSGGTKTAGSNNTATTGQTKTTSTSTTGGQTGSAKPSPSPTPRPKQRRSNHRVGM
ncbi:MAG: hypothetical protein DMF76_07750 [Acidobacteria bacterium]|nr:MAG: hypothetical protein DMF76_07750 [Acidobacteriota bacterium]